MPQMHNTAFPRLTGPQVRQFAEALLQAVTPQQLRRLLRILDKDYNALAPQEVNYKSALYAIIRTANRYGWAGELLREARERNPGSLYLIEFEQLFSCEQSPPDNPGAEPKGGECQGGL